MSSSTKFQVDPEATLDIESFEEYLNSAEFTETYPPGQPGQPLNLDPAEPVDSFFQDQMYHDTTSQEEADTSDAIGQVNLTADQPENLNSTAPGVESYNSLPTESSNGQIQETGSALTQPSLATPESNHRLTHGNHIDTNLDQAYQHGHNHQVVNALPANEQGIFDIDDRGYQVEAEPERVPISQLWLEEYGRNHPEFDVPNLFDHPILDAYATPEENFKLMMDDVMAKKVGIESWADHPYSVRNWSRRHPWPWCIDPDVRRPPELYATGPGKPADTGADNKCLTCIKNVRDCYDGKVEDGRCTTCQGKAAIRAYKKSLDGKESTASGQRRICYWPQREFFLNDHDSVKLFNKKARWCNENTAEAKSKRGKKGQQAEEDQSFEDDGGYAEATTAYEPPESQPPTVNPQGYGALPIPDLPAPSHTGAINGILNPVAHGLISVPSQSSDFTGAFSPAALERLYAPVSFPRRAKRRREEDTDEARVPSKRTRHNSTLATAATLGSGGESAGYSEAMPPNGDKTARSPERDNVEHEYEQMLAGRDQLYTTESYMDAAVIQAAVNIAKEDHAQALELAQNPRGRLFQLEKNKVLASWSGWTLDQMIDALKTIQQNHSAAGHVSDRERVLALRLQTALNISQGTRWGAPAAFLIRDQDF
ncbi:hypothetical protein PMZ80_003121 [Knufia obscura]|uniref:Uncharacterized protein n=1 Tax=Knufia obscura TaxID=1635080 RepID=A0ABR0RTB3_9EURO|nr:hypothetical protein PMZ80_003121 [Knufia obscura]